MKFGGFQKTSLLEYPDRISAIVWTVGCNFKCPFCYNTALVEGNVELIPEDEILSFLKKRKGMLEALSISGGEPLLQKDIADFTAKVKKLEYLVKIDTNGMYPKKLKELIDNKLVDYIAMDVKAPLERYQEVTRSKVKEEGIVRSVGIIKNSGLEYVFRTTVVPDLLGAEDIKKISQMLNGAKSYQLQQFVPVNTIDSHYMQKKPYTREEIQTFAKIADPYFSEIRIEGV